MGHMLNWFTFNMLTINVDKTQVRRGQSTANVAKMKFLAVIVDEKLNWKEHVSRIAGK